MENASNDISAKTLTTIIYALYGASFLLGFTAIVAIVMNYVKKDDVAGTFLESHFRWQIRTFWFGLLWAALGCAGNDHVVRSGRVGRAHREWHLDYLPHR